MTTKSYALTAATLLALALLAGCAGGAHDPAFVCDDPTGQTECRYSGEVGSGEGFGEGTDAEGEGEAEGESEE